MNRPHIVWLRRDLRLADQPALFAAAETGPVIPVYVLDDARAGEHRLGGASRWWLHHSLDALGRALAERGSALVLRRGDSVEELCRLVEETGAVGVHALRHYEPWWREAEVQLAQRVELQLHDGNYLMPPGSVRTGGGQTYRIYTPFGRALRRELPEQAPLPVPALSAPDTWPRSDRLEEWNLLPTKPDWSAGFAADWVPGEAAAHEQLARFVDHADLYHEERNLPSIEGSSRLSPRLQWGELSPAQIWHTLDGQAGEGADTFRSELVWRDFAQNIILTFPEYQTQNYRQAFERFPWRHDEGEIRAWQEGRTGYPIVDAGMRQLWQSGWLHNRVRMIVASFLIKHLLIDWRVGERWFWDTLVDADCGNNSVNWQWVSGTGVDTQLFTRVMAPLTQSDKFDAGDYIRRWVPELAKVPDRLVHDPPEGTYLPKIVGHREGRERALAAYRSLRDDQAS
ncbi:deoxyribodipyrimidine photolyase [Croceibacterium mercuriale]|uniref:Deoxyribodipyrimidine photolyase n=1 Tax=Croceibacterium mercuriale TaxID=1572751 RepID=A0A0B2BW00_9SPHN|nr:deoxyribodipyrimidine photo-lyase [Croceibacterium mercuriale]KHL25758.1 deoxyribodipyrimidine photolyase [Croceibacterium mercuriale]